MSRKNLLGLVLFACLVTTGLFAGATYMVQRDSANLQDSRIPTPTIAPAEDESAEPQLFSNPSDTGLSDIYTVQAPVPSGLQDSAGDTFGASGLQGGSGDASETSGLQGSSGDASDVSGLQGGSGDASEASGLQGSSGDASETSGIQGSTGNEPDPSDGTFSTSVDAVAAPQLITDSSKVDYMSYIPEMVTDSMLEEALDISNPEISIDAKAAILFDADSKEILYHKNAVEPVFPASTAKLLTSLTALKRCASEEEVTVGDEITMTGSGSTTAGLKQGEVLTVENLLAAMLLPSGNDAAYTMAAYVGRKSLGDWKASKEAAVAEFIRLMNLEAKELGVRNSCFKTPDGYDAIGQYTTAYDMGLIGIAAAQNKDIIKVSKKSNSRNVLVSGEDITWTNTNKLVTKYSGQYYSHAIGLKTGTSTMAGRCLIGAAKDGDRTVVCVIMDSSAAGRWEDAIALLKYGLDH